MKRRFIFGMAFMLLLSATDVLAEVEVTKEKAASGTSKSDVGFVPPVDVTPADGKGKFTVVYGDKVKKAQVDILESGRVVYTDVENAPRNTSVTYRLRNATPGSTYFVRVKTDGVVRAVEEVPVE